MSRNDRSTRGHGLLKRGESWMAKSADSERSRPTWSGIGPWRPDLGGGGNTHPPTGLGWIDRNRVESARLRPIHADSTRSWPLPREAGPFRIESANPSLRRDRESRGCLRSPELPPSQSQPPSLPAPPPSGGPLPRHRCQSSEEACRRRHCTPPPLVLPFSSLFLFSSLSSFSLPINVDDDDDLDPEFTVVARASRRSYAEEDERRRGLGTSGSHLSRDDSRRSLPRSTSVRRAADALGCGGRLSDVHAPTQGPMDTYLYRSRSVKQPGIKQVLKGVSHCKGSKWSNQRHCEMVFTYRWRGIG
ncbi:hypothetical protein Taro_026541 [Colocasia esculenta]|uniref:Uncharacterized protein n=1 Tax=Colocasia esculenta TaxID=4460 RepID=A0A843VHF8_COLES|nr:hypothetical protein [Colocasia esculenta]